MAKLCPHCLKRPITTTTHEGGAYCFDCYFEKRPHPRLSPDRRGFTYTYTERDRERQHRKFLHRETKAGGR